ncbi:MAG: CBS domain-containing protein [Saprospiraceae bacterium]
MGDFRVRKIIDAEDRRKMYQSVLADVEVFERMLKEDIFEKNPLHIGAEQELCIVNHDFEPSMKALGLLDEIEDEHYTNELALFNLEINLDPFQLHNNCFSAMEKQLFELLGKGKKIAAQHQAHLLMTGILPTLKYRHLKFENMTPIQRYQTLSKKLSELRGANFEIHMQGVDEVILSLGSVLFEACNTSFQLHLQMRPEEFVNQHNWSQMISGPVLSACVNSPMLFGNELWAESRIALFKQSLDTRSSEKFLRKKLPRVYFGEKWLQESAAELWKNDVMRFPLIVTSDDFQDAKALLQNGEIPNLRAIRLHNGTTYTWNRLCYGFSKTKPHLRIECRYIPSGPTGIDEIANFAFWTGLMKSEPEGGVEFWKNQDFKVAKENFIKAARTGLNSVFEWYGKNYSAKELLLYKLIPQAEEGLKKSNVAPEDIEKYLGVFEKRVEAEVTGSSWTVKNFRKLSKHFGETIAEKELVKQMLEYQEENIPLHEWENFNSKIHSISTAKSTVEDLMTKDIFSVRENVSFEFLKHILKWNNIHHLPVENKNGDLIGLITDGMVERYENEFSEEPHFAKDIMLEKFVSISATTTLEQANEMMEKSDLSGVPVVYKNKLVGMITQNDMKVFYNKSN